MPDEALKHFLSMRKEVKGSALSSALGFFRQLWIVTTVPHGESIQDRKGRRGEKSQELKQEVSKQDGLIRKKGVKV